MHVVSIKPPIKEVFVRYTMISFKPLSDYDVEDIVVFLAWKVIIFSNFQFAVLFIFIEKS